MSPRDRLRHHVTGAIERGEAQPIAAILPAQTLDEAVDLFDHEPSDTVCANLLRTAIAYHRDEMIESATLHTYVERVAEWLADD